MAAGAQGQLLAAEAQCLLIDSREVLKFDAATKPVTVTNHSVDSQALIRMWKDEFNLNELSNFQLCGNVDCHSLLRKVMALPLKNTSALLRMEEQLDREIHSKSLRTASSRNRDVGGGAWHYLLQV